MKKLKVKNFEEMSILELVEYIEEKKRESKEEKEEIVKYFKKVEEKKVVPYYFADFYIDLIDEYNILDKVIEKIEENEINYTSIPKIIVENSIYGYNEEIKKSKLLKIPIEIFKPSKIHRKGIFYENFRYMGIYLFLDELLEKGYFESGKANELLEHLIDKVYKYRYKYNDDIMTAIINFMRDKGEEIQIILGELFIKYVKRTEMYVNILLTAYKIENNFIKRGVMRSLISEPLVSLTGPDDFASAKVVLDLVAEDMEGEDEILRALIISFIGEFPEVEEEIKKYLKNEKGILFDKQMMYEVSYDKVKSIKDNLENRK